MNAVQLPSVARSSRKIPGSLAASLSKRKLFLRRACGIFSELSLGV
jgi:hypothetical protein